MTERNRGLDIFRSLRKKKNRGDKKKSQATQDDSIIAYNTSESMATTPAPSANEKPAKQGSPVHKAKKSSWTNIFKPWKWRKKKKEKQNKNGDQNGPLKEQTENENDTNHEGDPRNGDQGVGDSGSSPLVTTEVEINRPEDNNSIVPNSHFSTDAQLSSTIHSSYGAGDAPPQHHENGPDQPGLPPKTGSPDSSPYRAPADMSEQHNEGVKRTLNFAGAEVVGHSVQNEHYEDSDSDYDNNIQYRDDDSEEDDEEPSSLAAKVRRNDSLAFHLSNRPSRTALEERNIIPAVSHDAIKEKRDKVGANLVRRLSERPSKDELEQRNIYKEPDSETRRREALEEKKRTLVRKLSFRPTVDELRARNIILFNEYVEVIEALSYDRKAEKPWTKLTPQDKAYIRKELNEFKSTEMAVHEDSRKYTRFHKP